MTALHDRLVEETAAARSEFLAIPILENALDGQVPRALYVEFLRQAYHHVRHTCPLLSLAAVRTDDTAFRASLHAYLAEEEGHDAWILSDIDAMGGNAEEARLATPRPPCRAMVAYAYYAIEWISPYALMGMVHVLEGMSALLATRAANALAKTFRAQDGGGFLYLLSHGALDVEHTAFFRDVVNRIEPPWAGEVIIDSANMTYWLYGNVFRDLGRGLEGQVHEARR